jgi:hypothetical protein
MVKPESCTDPNDAQVSSSGNGSGIDDETVDLPCHVSLEAADDLAFGLAFGRPTSGIGLGGRISGEAVHHDSPQCMVGLAVARTVETVRGLNIDAILPREAGDGESPPALACRAKVRP